MSAMEQLIAMAKKAPKKPAAVGEVKESTEKIKRAPKSGKLLSDVKNTTIAHFPTQATNTNLIISKAKPKSAKKTEEAPKEKKPRATRVKKPLLEGEVAIEKKPRKQREPKDPNAPKKAKLPSNEARCMKCKKGVSCAGCDLVTSSTGKKMLKGKCPDCGTGISKFVANDYVKA